MTSRTTPPGTDTGSIGANRPDPRTTGAAVLAWLTQGIDLLTHAHDTSMGWERDISAVAEGDDERFEEIADLTGEHELHSILGLTTHVLRCMTTGSDEMTDWYAAELAERFGVNLVTLPTSASGIIGTPWDWPTD